MTADITIEETVQKISLLTENTLNALFSKWEKMYKLNDEFKRRSFESFVSHVEELYECMLSTEESRLMKLTEEVEKKIMETIQLEKDLGVSVSKVNSDLPLKNLISELDNAMEEFRKMKEAKIQHFETLLEKESELCKFLGKTTLPQCDHFPKEKDFENLELYIFELSQEKIERIELFKDIKSRIKHMMDLLGLKPDSEYEKEVLNNCDEPIALTEEDMNKIKELETLFNEKVNLEKNNKIYKLEKLQKLWSKVDIAENEKQEFLIDLGIGFTQEVFIKLEKEFERCEAIKQENITPLILRSREKLKNLWDKVKYSEEQRKECYPYYSPFFNEDVLELLEIQVEKLNNYYEENKGIFELVEKWTHLSNRMIHLEELSKNKKRLFDNRGGQLLKEEKERKSVESNLPKVYAELEKVLMAYQEKTGSPFLYEGDDLLIKLRDEWLSRETALKKKTISRPGSPGPLGDQRSAQKRKLPYTPQSASKLMATSRYHIRSKAKPPPSTPASNSSEISNCSLASYTEFQEQIESRSKTPRRHLETQSRNTPLGPSHSSPTFTPVKKKTPCKNAYRATPKNTVSASKLIIITPKHMPTSRLMNTPKNVMTSATRLLTTPKSRFATPDSTNLKNSSNRKGTPKSAPSLITRSRFTPAAKFNLKI